MKKKEKQHVFLSWLGFNRQNNNVAIETKTAWENGVIGVGGETRAPVTTTATVTCGRGEVTAAVEEALVEANVKIFATEQTLISDLSASKDAAQCITTEVMSLTEEEITWRSHAGTNNQRSMSSVPENDTVASSITMVNAITPKNHQDVTTALTLAAKVIHDEDIVLLSTEDGATPVLERTGFFTQLKNSLVKTRQNLGSGFIGLFRGKKINDNWFEELEEQLLGADVGVETTSKIMERLTTYAERCHLKDGKVLYNQLRVDMATILTNVEQPLKVVNKKPFVILMVGVNGVGKTTTIGKFARQYQAEGKSVMLAAGDTFRTTAIEQLQAWGERNHIPVVAQQTGADSASVIFDAIQAAKARDIDIVIADTAGRLQNKLHLMNELKKIVRVIKKLDIEAPHEIMLTIDASTGQNAISQVNSFNDAVGLTGITLTKLDGTAKGGVIFAIADRFGIPIRYIGVGDGIEDLRPFRADDFIEALLPEKI